MKRAAAQAKQLAPVQIEAPVKGQALIIVILERAAPPVGHGDSITDTEALRLRLRRRLPAIEGLRIPPKAELSALAEPHCRYPLEPGAAANSDRACDPAER